MFIGEKFRVDIVRRFLEFPDPIVIKEFTSVVDRQVAKIGSHAIQKCVRKNNWKLVVITCYYNIEEWLQPDWIYNVGLKEYRVRGSLQWERSKL